MQISTDCRDWFWYVVPMPLDKKGRGPVTESECCKIIYQVWNKLYLSYEQDFEYLPDAINKALELNKEHMKENK